MRFLLLFIASSATALLIIFGAAVWRYDSLSTFPEPSQEIMQITPEKRQVLARLRNEQKFEPHEYPPLGYTGVATPEEEVIARAAVNAVLDEILLREDGPISAKAVSALIRKGMRRVQWLETEDRDRTADYMIEIWYLLGFRGAIGPSALGPESQIPEGYGEPLPPGWRSPTEPRPIGED